MSVFEGGFVSQLSSTPVHPAGVFIPPAATPPRRSPRLEAKRGLSTELAAHSRVTTPTRQLLRRALQKPCTLRDEAEYQGHPFASICGLTASRFPSLECRVVQLASTSESVSLSQES